MAKARVLRFARADDESAFVIINVTSKGPKPLDVKLVGTEGEAPYATSLKHDCVSSLKVKNCPASDTEWQSILESILDLESLPHIYTTATVQSEVAITITIRKEIQGITQRLGSITLKHEEYELIELFDWCGTAAELSVSSREAIAEVESKESKAEATVKELQSQLEELILAKEEDEAALLQKFRDLLNEKKVKIREQQRVLASRSFTPVDGNNSSSQQGSQIPSSQPTRKPGASRSVKRKAPASKHVDDEEDEEVDDMDVDIKMEQGSDLGNATEDTASITSDNDAEDAEEEDIAATSIRGSSSADPVPEPRHSQQDSAPKNSKEAPPPRRKLPFTKKQAKEVAKPVAVGSETDSDDEL